MNSKYIGISIAIIIIAILLYVYWTTRSKNISLKDQISALILEKDAIISKITTEKVELDTKIVKCENDFATSMVAQEGKINTLKGEIASLTNTINLNDSAIAILNAKKSALDVEITEYIRISESYKAEITKLTNDKAILDNKIATLSTKYEQQIVELRTKYYIDVSLKNPDIGAIFKILSSISTATLNNGSNNGFISKHRENVILYNVSKGLTRHNNRVNNNEVIHTRLSNAKIINKSPNPTIVNKWNFPGNDIGSQFVKSMDDCLDKCKNTDGCNGVAFAPSNGKCWTKRKLYDGYAYDGIITGIMPGYDDVRKECDDSCETTPECVSGSIIDENGMCNFQYANSLDYLDVDIDLSYRDSHMFTKGMCDKKALLLLKYFKKMSNISIDRDYNMIMGEIERLTSDTVNMSINISKEHMFTVVDVIYNLMVVLHGELCKNGLIDVDKTTKLVSTYIDNLNKIDPVVIQYLIMLLPSIFLSHIDTIIQVSKEYDTKSDEYKNDHKKMMEKVIHDQNDIIMNDQNNIIVTPSIM